jgi:glycosyltransferase involved in cell wall biosynthesis
MPEPKTRILLLGDARQVHLKRWSRYLIDADYDVITASLEPVEGIPGKREQIRVPEVLPDCLRYPMAVPAVRGIIRRFAPHLINAHFTPNYGVIAAMSGFRPWVLSTWGSDIMLLPERSPFHMIRTKFVIERADCVTSDAVVMSEKLVTLGATPSRVLTFPFGVDRNVFYPAQRTGTGDAPLVLSNRKIEPIYNIDTIISAFPGVTSSLAGAKLTVAGSGALAKKLRTEVMRTNAAPSIDFVGDVEHARMPGLLRKHDIFVSIASSDTTSVSLLEAMACGLFPIVSDVPANREWIRDGENGLIVPPRAPDKLARAIIDAWDNKELRNSAKKQNADLIAARADWYENMAMVRNEFDRLIEPVEKHP